MSTGRSAGNLNNHVGVPLSILRLDGESRVAVLEMAMNHPGEIRRLAEIARPDIGVVTNVGHAHAEAFGSIEEIALAKRELIETLPRNGTAVLNADDPRVARFREIHPGPAVTFGLSEEADVRAEAVEYREDGVRFRLNGAIEFEAPLAGRHGLMNLLAALTVARVFGITAGSLRDAVRSIAAGPMRGRRFSHNGIEVIDDCYNSNPEAACAMLDALRGIPARRHGAVLGEMLELGRWSESLHRDVGRYAARCGICVLVGIRGAARHMVEEAVKFGLPDSAAFFFEDPAGAGDCARGLFREGDAVLFKGSRGTRVELVLERFLK
jgi:UDP-N-acetylmuramoyl-tripeptide--D-alanyl-D-alanine ligase